jgi:DNA-binding CsgD family transcriptional regulator
MEQLDTLLQLITHLQDDRDTARGRQLLLEYARTTNGARLSLLFRVDAERRQLLLLARNGRRPRHASGQHSPESMPLHGCFGAALETHGLLSLHALHADRRSLPEERYWTWPGGLVVACAVGQHGVLVLCFAPQKQTKTHDTSMQLPTFDEGSILICASLLSGYLTTENLPVPGGAAALSGERALPAYYPSPGEDAERTAAPPDTGTAAVPPTRTEHQDRAMIDQERERIARDIHDGPAQQIATVLHRLEYIQRILVRQPQTALREIGRARQTLDEGLRDLRQCIATPIPAPLQHQSFAEALHSFIQGDERLHVSIESGDLTFVPPALEVLIYHLVQEALNNVRKHAQAQRVVVLLRVSSGFLLVEIRDDGKGFDSKTLLSRMRDKTEQQSIGLRAMRDRVQEAGGTWELHSTPGRGTTVRASFPLARQRASIMPSARTTRLIPLTRRERDVLRLLIDGQTNRAIAEQLSVSIETVKSHVHHIMQKMNAKDRTHAAVLATKQHWV